jgi:hypothetical protein
MFLRIGKGLSIDNLNGYSAKIVAQLELVLESGAIARPDPKRVNFYDVEDTKRVFFIYAAPGSGRVILLASWPAASSNIGFGEKATTGNTSHDDLALVAESFSV